jgi:hypothetical protein
MRNQYKSQEEHDHFEGAMEQSIPQEKDMEQRLKDFFKDKKVSETALLCFVEKEIALAFEATKVERKHDHKFKTFEGTCYCGANRTQLPVEIGYNQAIADREQKEKEYLNKLNKGINIEYQ